MQQPRQIYRLDAKTGRMILTVEFGDKKLKVPAREAVKTSSAELRGRYARALEILKDR